MTLAAIRVDATPERGLGNLERSWTLSKKLADEGHRVVFVTVEGTLGEERLLSRGANVKTVKEQGGQTEAIEALGPGIVVFDIGRTRHEWISRLKASEITVLTFDDLGEGRYLADIVVDANLSERTNPRIMDTTTRFLLGPDYAVLSSSAMSCHRRRRKTGDLRRIVIAFGGSDPEGVTPEAVRELGLLDSDIDVEVVLGAGFSAGRKLDRALLDSPRQFDILTDPPDFADRLASADLGLISGGLTLFEAAHFDLPSIVIAQNKEQLSNLRPFAEAGGVVDLGLASHSPGKQILPEVKRLLARDERQRMSKALSGMVDGRGAERIVKVLREVHGR